MMSGRREYLMSCPFSKQMETVHLYYINDATAFNGCDNGFHQCNECEQCRIMAQKLFDRENEEGLLPHGHSRV